MSWRHRYKATDYPEKVTDYDIWGTAGDFFDIIGKLKISEYQGGDGYEISGIDF